MILRSLAAIFLVQTAIATDLLTVCGADEIYQIDPAASPLTKLWSWRAKAHPEIPEALGGTFNTTDECKPVDGGKKMLVCSSGGGCALLEMPSGKAIWWAKVTNAHSIESIPGGLIAVASSVGATGNKVVFFDSSVPEQPASTIELPSAHGLVWDSDLTGLWALGFKELVFCQTTKGEPGSTFSVRARYPLPDEDGHDLRQVPHSTDLVVSTHSHVWRFDRDDRKFRPDPYLKDRVEAKCIDIHPRTGQIAVVQASGENWWTDFVEFVLPAVKVELKNEKVYKARWFIARD